MMPSDHPERSVLPRSLTVVALALVGGLAAFTLGTQDEVDPPEIATPVVVSAEQLQVSGPDRIGAGDGFVIAVDGVEPGRAVTTNIDTGYGIRAIETMPDGSSVDVAIDPFLIPASGTTIITVVQGTRSGTATMEIEPGPPVGPIDVYLGPRTVIADNEHFVMLVAVPEDRLGNPVATGTPVDFRVTRPDLSVELERFDTVDLLAWFEVFSSTKTGRTRVATESGSAGAAERTFLEVAGIPVEYGLELIDPMLPADGNALLTIGTEPLVDRFGNHLPDGTNAVLDISGVTGARRIFGQTIDGRGLFTFEVPDEPGEIVAVATASGVRSDPLRVTFEPAVESIPAEFEELDDLAAVHIGPVRSVRGSFVPEGTAARVTTADGLTVETELTLGEGVVFLSLDADLATITVEVLGSEFVLRPTR